MRVLVGSIQVCLALLWGLRSCSNLDQPLAEPWSEPLAQGLIVGQPAPDLSGEDLDGVPLQLSDYHGQVVVLACWASW